MFSKEVEGIKRKEFSELAKPLVDVTLPTLASVAIMAKGAEFLKPKTSIASSKSTLIYGEQVIPERPATPAIPRYFSEEGVIEGKPAVPAVPETNIGRMMGKIRLKTKPFFGKEKVSTAECGIDINAPVSLEKRSPYTFKGIVKVGEKITGITGEGVSEAIKFKVKPSTPKILFETEAMRASLETGIPESSLKRMLSFYDKSKFLQKETGGYLLENKGIKSSVGSTYSVAMPDLALEDKPIVSFHTHPAKGPSSPQDIFASAFQRKQFPSIQQDLVIHENMIELIPKYPRIVGEALKLIPEGNFEGIQGKRFVFSDLPVDKFNALKPVSQKKFLRGFKSEGTIFVEGQKPSVAKTTGGEIYKITKPLPEVSRVNPPLIDEYYYSLISRKVTPEGFVKEGVGRLKVLEVVKTPYRTTELFEKYGGQVIDFTDKALSEVSDGTTKQLSYKLFKPPKSFRVSPTQIEASVLKQLQVSSSAPLLFAGAFSSKKTFKQATVSNERPRIQTQMKQVKVKEAVVPLQYFQAKEVIVPVSASSFRVGLMPLAITSRVNSFAPLIPERVLQVERPIQTEQVLQVERPLQVERSIQAVQPLQVERPIQTEQVLQVERPLQVQKPLQVERPLQVQRSMQLQRSLQLQKPLQVQRMVQLQKPMSITPTFPLTPRSEERRVGKECRSRWSPYH